MRTPRSRLVTIGAVALVAVASTALIVIGRTDGGSASSRWVGTWAAAQHAAGSAGLSHTGFENQTLRMTVHTSIGGSAARVRLSNVFGVKPLTIGSATIGLPDHADRVKVVPSSMHRLMFAGRPTVVVRPGAEVISDAVAMEVPALGDLTVSVWLPHATGVTTFHTVSRATSYVGSGAVAEDVHGAAFRKISVANPIPGKTDSPWFFLSGIDVLNRSSHGSVVVFGDSISDGFTSAVNANGRWPDLLARRLRALPPSRHAPSVLNESLSGNSLGREAALVPQLGPNAMSRVHGDVLGQTGVRTVIVQLGINDILIFNSVAESIIAHMRQIALQAHEAGLQVMICTLTPAHGWSTWTPEREQTRTAVNAYVRTTSDFDAVVDLDAALADQFDPTRLRPGVDSGDHLHPNARGFQAIADSMPLDLIAA